LLLSSFIFDDRIVLSFVVSRKFLSSIPWRLGPADVKLEFVREFVLVRVSIFNFSCDGVRSLFLIELRRLTEPFRLNERLNESLEFYRMKFENFKMNFSYPRLTKPFDVV